MVHYYEVEYARSGRSKCQKCNRVIGNKSLRLSRVVDSPFHEGELDLWYHAKCFFTLPPESIPTTVDHLKGFKDLKETDQKKVREWVDKNFETVEEGKGKSAGTEERERKPGGEGSEDEAGEPLEGKPVVEYAKSAKSVCRLCSQNIEMGEVRVGKLTTSEDIAFRGLVPAWHHVSCYFSKKDPDWKVPTAEYFGGFEQLKNKDQSMLQEYVEKSNDPGATKESTDEAQNSSKEKASVKKNAGKAVKHEKAQEHKQEAEKISGEESVSSRKEGDGAKKTAQKGDSQKQERAKSSSKEETEVVEESSQKYSGESQAKGSEEPEKENEPTGGNRAAKATRSAKASPSKRQKTQEKGSKADQEAPRRRNTGRYDLRK